MMSSRFFEGIVTTLIPFGLSFIAIALLPYLRDFRMNIKPLVRRQTFDSQERIPDKPP